MQLPRSDLLGPVARALTADPADQRTLSDWADHLGVSPRTDGRVHAADEPAEVLTVETVRAAFGLESQVITDPTSGRPLMLPLGRHRVDASVSASA